MVTSREELPVLAPVSGIVTSPVPVVGASVRRGEVLARISGEQAFGPPNPACPLIKG